MAIIDFLATTTGRWVRIIAGIALIALGLLFIPAPTGVVVSIIGLVPLIAGVVDVCVFAPLLGRPFTGKQLRGE